MRAKLKGGKMRYVPMPPELAGELRRFMPKLEIDNVRFIAAKCSSSRIKRAVGIGAD